MSDCYRWIDPWAEIEAARKLPAPQLGEMQTLGVIVLAAGGMVEVMPHHIQDLFSHDLNVERRFDRMSYVYTVIKNRESDCMTYEING